MHDLSPLTGLGARTPREDTIGAVVITEAPDWALASVTARAGEGHDCREILADLLGAPCPEVARHAQGPQHGAFWIGAESWMIEAPFDPARDLALALRTVLGARASVTEQTDAWVRFDLSAPDLAPLLERLSNLDHAGMAPGTARRTVIDHMGCYLLRHAGHATIYAPRSTARSLHHAIVTAARSQQSGRAPRA